LSLEQAMTTLWFETALAQTGWETGVRLIVEDGRIVSVQAGVLPQAGDERGSIGLPGVGNLHSHAFQRAMAGLAETRSPGGQDFWSWREVMYRFVGALTPEEVEAIAAQAFAEMVASGFTRVGEFHYLHNDIEGLPYANPGEMAERIAAAAGEAGIGLTLLPVFYAHGGFGGEAPAPRQARFLSSIDSYGEILAASVKAIASLPDGRLGVAPHSLRAVTPDELAAVTSLTPDGPVHIHVAEQTAEVEACLAWSGARPVEWLLANADVGPRWCLVHATHMNDAESVTLALSSAVAGLCPITEANLGDGLFLAGSYLGAGGAFGVGSDSNVRIDLSEELRLFEYGQRLALRSRGMTGSGAELFRGALAGGGQALGEAVVGLAAGAAADVIELDGDHPSLCGRAGDALLDSWIFAAGKGAIKTVWRRGERLVEGGRHERGEAIARRYRAALQRILDR
jgi:formiminoglutamate deiminase